ncbi:MAG: hypothetical protein ACI9HY_000589 [Planctomycetaceae bacterium]
MGTIVIFDGTTAAIDQTQHGDYRLPISLVYDVDINCPCGIMFEIDGAWDELAKVSGADVTGSAVTHGY